MIALQIEVGLSVTMTRNEKTSIPCIGGRILVKSHYLNIRKTRAIFHNPFFCSVRPSAKVTSGCARRENWNSKGWALHYT